MLKKKIRKKDFSIDMLSQFPNVYNNEYTNNKKHTSFPQYAVSKPSLHCHTET